MSMKSGILERIPDFFIFFFKKSVDKWMETL